MRYPALALIFFAGIAPVAADPIALHGRLELEDSGAFARGDSIDAMLGAANRNDFSGNLRLSWEPAWGRWSVAIHYVAALDDGDDVRLLRAEKGLLPAPPSTWFNLTERFVDHAQVFGTQKSDRLSITYTAPQFVIRRGR